MFLVAALVLYAGPFSDVSDREICQTATLVSEKYETPVITKWGTQGRSVANCKTRTVVWPFTFSKSQTWGQKDLIGNELRRQFQDELNQKVCTNDIFAEMNRRGWRFSTSYTFKDGAVVNMKARCS
jgi:hypothetical protein